MPGWKHAVLLLVVVACSSTSATPGAVATTKDGGAPGSSSGSDASIEGPNDGGTAPIVDGATASGLTCPAGSTLLFDRTACPGAVPAAPTSLADPGASAGDVVSLGGLDDATVPCLPALVCRPATAPALLFSDSPESPSADGVLYADSPPAGSYRIYVYHANGGAPIRKFPVVVLNQGAADATVTIARRGIAAPTTDYVAMGKAVLADWFTDQAPVLVTIPAGKRVLLDADLDASHASQAQLVHAIYDVTTSAPLKISVVSVLANADAAATAAGLSLLTRDPNHQRGTFPYADLLVVPTGDGARSGVQRLRMGANVVDAPITGTDAPTGDAQTLTGNFGVTFRFAWSGLAAGTRGAIAPRGGAWAGAGLASGAVVTLPSATSSLASTTDGIALGSISGELAFATGGGSSLPVDLLVVTP